MIEVQNLNKSYPHKGNAPSILNDINLHVKAGEVFGIIGKSGAGKSTLLKCLNLLEMPDSGEIVIDGVKVNDLKKSELRKFRHQIGMVFQGFNLLNSKTVFSNIALPLVLQGNHTKAEIKQRVLELLELVGLSSFANKYPPSLSGGQKQRVGIARALATSPKILLSDEATSALDPQTTNSILELLLDINKALGVTIVLITHEIDVVRKICDKVAVLDSGNIVEVGETPDIILHPRHEVTRRLIIEEESHKYLEKISSFYQFTKEGDRHLLLLSFVGNKTFTPIISKITAETGIYCSILHGELGRIKHMPFGQMLIEIATPQPGLDKVCLILQENNVHYEIVK